MKKILTAMVLFVFVALPMSVMAMTTISDSDLSAVTGQAGVSIGADITMNLNAGIIAWGDNDGFGTYSNAGWIGLQSLAIDNLRMHMRTDDGMADLQVGYNYYTGMLTGAGTLAAFTQRVALGGTNESLDDHKAMLASVLGTQQLLTIDVGTDGTGKTAVHIGLPTFEIDMATMSAAVGLWSGSSAAPTSSSFQKLGDIYVQNMVAYVGKNNYVDISKNETASGVLIVVGNSGTGNMLDSFKADVMSWGDTDGLTSGSTTNSGYVGLTNVAATAIKVAATLSINVATPNGHGVPGLIAMNVTDFGTFSAAIPALLAANDVATKDLVGYLLHDAKVIGTTSVDIQIQANINIGTLVATAALGPDKTLANASTLQNVLGQLYVKNLNLVVPAYSATPVQAGGAGGYAASWVTISAH